MTEEEWLRSEAPASMLEFLTEDLATHRKLRLFSAACCERVRLLAPGRRMGLEDAAYYIDVLERQADGATNLGEWDEAVQRVLIRRDEICDETCDALQAEFCTFLCAIDNDPPAAARWASVNANIALSSFPQRPEPHEAVGTPESCIQATLIRCVFGSPFHPVALDPAWLTSTVVALARGIYEDRAFDRLPILADALQDAGCDHPDILDHCRGPGPHARGCWVVDLVLGKA